MSDGADWTRRSFLRRSALLAAAATALPRVANAVQAPPSQAATAAPAPPAANTATAGGPAQRVVVIGAGLAGLAAAYELVQAGHDVTVLEAGHRAGGRVWTLREPFADGLYAEAGAINYGDAYRNLVRYVKTFGLATASPAPPKSPLTAVEHLRGHRLELAPGREPEWPFDLTAEERASGLSGLFQKYLLPIGGELGDPTAPGWVLQRWAAFDRETLHDLLRRRGASDGAIQLLASNMPYGYGWSEVSALHRLVSDLALVQAGGLGSPRFLAGGSDRLPQAFATALRERIRYRAPVTRILCQPDRVRVVFRQGGEESVLEADRAICAAPLPALRKIGFTPELPAAKQRILSGLAYAPVTRIFLQTRRRFWAEHGFAGFSPTDLPIQLVSEHPFVRAEDQTRGLLECHVKGPEAERIGAMDDDVAIALAVQNLEKIHPGFKSWFETAAVVRWHTDPFAGGGYAWWKPTQLTTWMPELAKPEGRLHFAGEHTSALARTQEGALESGNRAAREIAEAMRLQPAPAGG